MAYPNYQMQGLQEALPEGSMGPGFDPQNDPNGFGLQQRANERTDAYNQQRTEESRGNPQMMASDMFNASHAPAPDPSWDKFYQAMYERAPGGAKGMPGLPNDQNPVNALKRVRV